MSLLLGDCVEQMKTLPDNSVDAVVCDPPYELGFMGKSWDASGIAYSVEMWKEVLRVTKPGGHLLAFGGTRTYHRMACAIEDAGFEIRDQLQWLYGSGFPKSYNIGKGIEKFKTEGNASWNGTGDSSNGALGYSKLQFNQRYRNKDYSNAHVSKVELKDEDAINWSGWGSALKPMNEPICLARKPLSEKNLVENVLKWGVGGLNIDASKIGFASKEDYEESVNKNQHADFNSNGGIRCPTKGIYSGDFRLPENYNPVSGRFPGNVLLDEESAKMLDEQSGIVSQGHWAKTKVTGFGEFGTGKSEYFGVGAKDKTKSGASRFFYVAKASKSERNRGCESLELKQTGHGNLQNSKGMERFDTYNHNHHPTVKPVKLMEYLVRLVTPKGGIVLDPFMGSGTTGIACKNLGFRFVGIEKEVEYFAIAKARIENSKGLK